MVRDWGKTFEAAGTAATAPPSAPTVLREAAALIAGERRAQYGDAREEFRRVALLWSGLLGVPVAAREVGLCLAALKLVREAHRPKRDNLVDACGYLQLTADCSGK